MASKTDGELLTIAESPAGTYRAEALQAALDELKKRNLSPRPVEQVQKVQEAVDASNAAVPLEVGWVLAPLLMPMFFFPWFMVASDFERNG